MAKLLNAKDGKPARDVRLLSRAISLATDAKRAIKPDGGDLGGGSISGAIVCTVGNAAGHGVRADAETLAGIVALGNALGAGGLPLHLTHAHMASRQGYDHANDGVLWYLGRVKNFALDGDAVRADLHLDPAADKSPHGALREFVLARAQSDVSSFGASLAMRTIEVTPQGQEDELPAMRPERLIALDIVGAPALNDALLSEREPEGRVDPKLLAEFEAMKTQIKTLGERHEGAIAENKVLAAQLAKVEQERAAEKAAREQAEAASLRVTLTAEFDAAVREGKALPAEREMWLGKLDDKGALKLLADGTPEKVGHAIQHPAFFREQMASRPRLHSQPVIGGSGAPIVSLSAHANHKQAVDERVKVLVAENPGMPMSLATEEALRWVAAFKPEIHAAYRAALPGRVG